MAQIKLNATYGLTGTLPAVSGANLTSLTSGNLTGALPAISGANLTGLSAGGKILQVQSATSNTTYNMYSTTELTTITCAITPSATSSTILIMFSVPRTENSDPQQDGAKRGRYFLLRDSTKIFDGGNDSSFSNLIGEDGNHETVSGNVIDSPSSTSAITYKVNFNTNTATTNGRWNRANTNYAGTMTMVLMEIDGS